MGSHNSSPGRPYLELPQYNPYKKQLRMGDRDFKPIVWIDCEMTGLDVFKDHVIEVCCIITDGDLNIIDPGYESVIHYDKNTMDSMSDWCLDHHHRSGLTQRVLESTKTLEQVEQELLDYLRKFTAKGCAVMAGNTVHQDRFFLQREMPSVIEHLSFKMIDVTSVMEIGNRHNQRLVRNCPDKRHMHTAKSDILESIAQLKWLRENYFVQPTTWPSPHPTTPSPLPMMMPNMPLEMMVPPPPPSYPTSYPGYYYGNPWLPAPMYYNQ